MSGAERTLSKCIATSQFDRPPERTFLCRPVGVERTTQIGSASPHDAGALEAEVRWSDASRPRHAQVAGRRSPVNGLLTNAA
jgi:hypothetical protein